MSAFLDFHFQSYVAIRTHSCSVTRAQLIIIPKPRRPLHQLSSFTTISGLPVILKELWKLFLKRLRPRTSDEKVVVRVHTLGSVDDMCFLYSVRQNKIWHPGLLYKIKKSFPYLIYPIHRSYISNRTFKIKIQGVLTELNPIEPRIHQEWFWIILINFVRIAPLGKWTDSVCYCCRWHSSVNCPSLRSSWRFTRVATILERNYRLVSDVEIHNRRQ